MRKPFLALIVPEGLIVLAAAALLRWDALLRPLAAFLPVYFYVAVAGAALLAVRFDRSAVLFALTMLVLADRALAWDRTAVLPVLAVLLPLNIAALALLPERPLLGAAGVRRALALLAQAAAVFLLARPEERGTRGLLEAPLLPSGLFGALPLGDLAILLFVAAAVVCTVVIVRRPHPVTRGLLWALVAGFLALTVAPLDLVPGLPAPTFLFATGALVLLTTVVEASHALAFRDGLTGLASRRAFDDALRRLAGPFALAMVDVDHFKSFNDRFGHAVGDQVLRMVATQLERAGSGGRAFRYGGEEFLLLFPNRAAADCLPLLERLRAAVEATTFTIRAPDRPRRRPKQPRRPSETQRVAVTISVGVAERTAGDAAPEATVKAADEALYRAKETGRNRVVQAGTTRGRASRPR